MIAVVGQTASGKTDYACRLANYYASDIVSADSRLVYTGMDIGTAKPDLDTQRLVTHHMIDLVPPSFPNYSLALYLREAIPLIESTVSRGQVPIVTGGTAFYFKALLDQMPLSTVKPNYKYRDSLEMETTDSLYKKLINPGVLHPNDRVRIIRALEIQEFSDDNTEQSIYVPQFNVLWIGLWSQDRDFMRQRVSLRSHQMLKDGLLDETENLLSQYGELDLFHRTIGYKEAIQYLKGEIESEEHLLQLIINSTNQYAKRQRIAFKTNPNINWLDIQEDSPEILLKKGIQLASNYEYK